MFIVIKEKKKRKEWFAVPTDFSKIFNPIRMNFEDVTSAHENS